MLTEERFLGVVDAAPLVAMDLVVLRGGSHILLGQRTNRPAQGWWFVPGGRIRKNETMQAALARVATQELGLDLADLAEPPVHLGAFEHFYDDCFAGEVGVSTHYVVMGNLLHLPSGTDLVAADGQHTSLRWWSLDEALASGAVHHFTKDYVNKLLQMMCKLAA